MQLRGIATQPWNERPLRTADGRDVKVHELQVLDDTAGVVTVTAWDEKQIAAVKVLDKEGRAVVAAITRGTAVTCDIRSISVYKGSVQIQPVS